MPNGNKISDVRLFVTVKGSGSFHVWGDGDPDALAPAWADKNLDVTLFSGIAGAIDGPVSVTSGQRGWICETQSAGIGARIELNVDGDGLTASLTISCPQNAARPLPLCTAELVLADIPVGADAVFDSAHHYGGGVHGVGDISELSGRGHAFANGCLGLSFPLVYLHSPASAAGIELEFMSEGRPTAWLRPGRIPGQATWAVSWETDRLLEPGQPHDFGHATRLTPYQGRPVERVRLWAQSADERFGLKAPVLPAWARNANIIEFDMIQSADRSPRGLMPMVQGDDPRFRDALLAWREMGYNVLYLIATNNTNRHSLSPLNYKPSERIGGPNGEQTLLRLAHELNYKVVLWITTVGIDMDSPEVNAHPEWFVHKPDGNIYCPYGDYAADADPLSTGWRKWLETEVTDVIHRGYDGIFVDGLTPRGSDHKRWSWPGEVRNAVNKQVRDLASMTRDIGGDCLVFVEDESAAMQAASGFTVGRYSPSAPKLKRYWSGIGIPAAPDHPSSTRIVPELVRDYLLMRYASLLPGVVSCDMLEGYYSDETLAWSAQSLLSGCSLKTFSTSVNAPEIFEFMQDYGYEPTSEALNPEYRKRGHSAFCDLLRFVRDEPLVRQTPVSIEAVIVHGDRSVVGFLHYFDDRAILALIQFAGRPAEVDITLDRATDLPATALRPGDGAQQTRWRAIEKLRSPNDAASVDQAIGAGASMAITLAPFGYRAFELVRAL